MQRKFVMDIAAANFSGLLIRQLEDMNGYLIFYEILNPMNDSFPRKSKNAEIFIFTAGYGEFVILTPDFKEAYRHRVVAGSLCSAEPDFPYFIRNRAGGHLKYLHIGSFSGPSKEINDQLNLPAEANEIQLPPSQEDFDKEILYYQVNSGLSASFEWIKQCGNQKQQPHYHKKSAEFVFVAAGSGYLNNGNGIIGVFPENWIRIDPGQNHIFSTGLPENLVLARIYLPAFSFEDIHL